MQKITCSVCGNEFSFDETPEESTAETTDIREMFAEILLNTQEQCTMIDKLVRSQVNSREEQINKLHDELQYYKDDHATRYINQVMKAVIKIHKDMRKHISSPDWENLSASDCRREYEYIFDDLTDLLQQQNIDAYHTKPGEHFDAAIHQVHRLEPTEDASLHETVKQSVSEGYIKSGKVFMPERVVVYKYLPKAEETTETVPVA